MTDKAEMLTKEQVFEAVKTGRMSKCLDGRDYGRLVYFFDAADWPTLGFELRGEAEPPTPKPWTREAVVEQLRADVAFGFEKALGQRGISAGLMYEVVKLWLWILQSDLQSFSGYAQYGLPLFKAAALEFGFENPIGEDRGDEHKYSSEGDY